MHRKMDRTELILHGSLWRAVLMIAVPVMINSFLQTLYNLTDTYWLGRIGKEPLAAINLVSPVQTILVNFGTGFTVEGAVYRHSVVYLRVVALDMPFLFLINL